MVRIQHPRATDAFARDPPSTVAVPIGGGQYVTRAVDEGQVDVPEQHAAATMDRLESSFDVEYDREGEAPYEIVGADSGGDSGDDAGDDPDGGGDEPPDDSEAVAETGADTAEGSADADDVGDDDAGDDEEQAGGEDDVEAWANWNEDDWKAMNYRQREADVLEGRVDDHLADVKRVEGSETVIDAVEQRADEINYNLEGQE